MQLLWESRQTWFPLRLLPGLCGSLTEIHLSFPRQLLPLSLHHHIAWVTQLSVFSFSVCWLSCFLSSKCCSYGGWLVLVGSDKAPSHFDLWGNESCHMFHVCPFQICYGNLSDGDTEERTRQNNNWCYQQQQGRKISFLSFSSYMWLFWDSRVNMFLV